MKERPVFLGPDPALVGILTEPPPAVVRRNLPGVIMLNAGVVHRVGPNRLHVRLGRALAAAGFPTLRFDLSGLGDSDPRTDTLSFTESAPKETREAMDYLSKAAGVDRFVLFGICSGAGTAFNAAMLDSRVVGAILVDPYAFPTLQFRLRYYARRLGQWSSWYNTLTGKNGIGRWVLKALGRRASIDTGTDAALTNVDPAARLPGRDAIASALRQLIDRGVQISLVFSGVPSNYNYQRQFEDAFPDVPLKGRVHVRYFKDADHTFSRLHMQNELIETLCAWTRSCFSHTPGANVTSWVPAAVLTYFL